MDISSMLEVQIKEMKEEADVSKENVTPRDLMPSTTRIQASTSQEEKDFHNLFGTDIAHVRYHKLHCTACDIHIGSAPSQIHNMCVHPILGTLLCAECREFYGDGVFEQGDDATDMFCRWCANGGNLYCCSYCSNTFCYKCIRRNFNSIMRKKIEAVEKWKCFVCNPDDLNRARSVCWALLQHVQTVTRILKHEKNMKPAEIEVKMNLDESQCCARKLKRKRRKPDSDSEEDETFNPNGTQRHTKRHEIKRIKLTSHFLNDIDMRQMESYSTTPFSTKPRRSLSASQSFQDVKSPTFTPNQSMTEQNISSEPIVIPRANVINSETPLSSRSDSNALQTSLPTGIVNSKVYVQTPTSHQIFFPPPPLQMRTSKKSHSLKTSSNAMVSIPKSTNKRVKTRRLLSSSKNANVVLTPNIIELDSDSDDELKIMEQHNPIIYNENCTDVTDVSSKIVVPVALVSTDNCNNYLGKEQLLRQMSTSLKMNDASFSQTMLAHSQELEKLLNNFKEKVYNIFVLSDNVQDVELAAQQKMKQFHQKMHDTVMQLTHINDRAVREYHKWKRSQKSQTMPYLAEHNILASEENVDISLDMTCINESDTESECEKLGCRVIEPIELIKNSSIAKDLFIKKDFVDRGTGENTVLFKDKETQVDCVSRNYEKCVNYSLLTKAGYDLQTKDSDLKSAAILDNNFGKYEEQFIFYLQHLENYGIEVDDNMRLSDSNETLPNSELLQDSVPPIISVNNSQRTDEEKNSRNCINLVTNNFKTNMPANKTMDKDNKIAQVITTKQDNAQSNKNLQQKKFLRILKDNNAVKMMAITLNKNDVDSSKCSTTDVATHVEISVSGSEEDCTIIDD